MALLQPLVRQTIPPAIKAATLLSLVERDIEEPPSYIEPSILPLGGQLFIASRAKTGKSFVMLELGRALASGDIPFGQPEFAVPQPVKVLMIEAELGELGLRKRALKIYNDDEIRRQGKNVNNFLYVSKQPELKIDDPKGIKALYALCEDVQPNVLMLDPWGRFHSSDENSAQEVGKLFRTVDELQKEFLHNEMAVISSIHMGKVPDQRAGFDVLDPYQIRGSSRFFDNVDSIITIERTHNLTTPHEAWSLRMRCTLRHGESPDDFIVHVNEFADSRVRYCKHVGKAPHLGKKLFTFNPSPVITPPVQLGFATA